MQLTNHKPQVPAKASQLAKMQVTEKDDGQTIEPPPRRKILAKRSKAQESTTPAHYPLYHCSLPHLSTN